MARILYFKDVGLKSTDITAEALKEALPEHEIIVPELPAHPGRALDMVRELNRRYGRIDLVVGSSFGAFYAMAFFWTKRLLINPAMFGDEDISKTFGTGMYDYTCELGKEEGICVVEDSFSESLYDAYDYIYSKTDSCNEEKLNRHEADRIHAMFATDDELFDHYDDFCRLLDPGHAVRFEGGHLLDKDQIISLVVPEIRELLAQPPLLLEGRPYVRFSRGFAETIKTVYDADPEWKKNKEINGEYRAARIRFMNRKNRYGIPGCTQKEVDDYLRYNDFDLRQCPVCGNNVMECSYCWVCGRDGELAQYYTDITDLQKIRYADEITKNPYYIYALKSLWKWKK